MKISLPLFLSLLLCVSIESIIPVDAESQCWLYPDPMNPMKKVPSPCGTQKKKKLKGDKTDEDISQSLSTDEAFQIVFSCGVSDQALCKKAENAFKDAGVIISSVLKINTPIVVNATFTNFCEALQECGGDILGAANAARTIPLRDVDNVVRQYPQALAKQFALVPEPTWGEFDIQAFFNAEAPLFFKGDGKIKPDQFDFEYIIVHELVHGLGFASSWNNYFGQVQLFNALTPDPAFLDEVNDIQDPVTFDGFEENAFDRHMVNTGQNPPVRMSDLTKQINSFTQPGKRFTSLEEMLTEFTNSDQFQITQSLFQDSTTPRTMAFQPQNTQNEDDFVFLETNLDPFRVGSSISHMNIVVFDNTSDFLEVFNAKRGRALDEIIASNGGTSAIGPKLKSVLETLGYASDDNPNPYKPRLPSDQTQAAVTPSPLPIGTSMRSSSTSMKSSFGILSTFIIATIALLLF